MGRREEERGEGEKGRGERKRGTVRQKDLCTSVARSVNDMCQRLGGCGPLSPVIIT